MGTISTILHKWQRQDGGIWMTHKPVLHGEAGYETWFVENSMVMAWLINSMEPEISQGYILYTTTKKIWDTTNLMYSNLGNNFKLYELSAKARAIQQGYLLVMVFKYFVSRNWFVPRYYVERPGGSCHLLKVDQKGKSLNSFLVCGLNLIKKGVGFWVAHPFHLFGRSSTW